MCDREAVVKSPGSIANLGPGFDVLAVALSGLHDLVHVKASPGTGLVRVYSDVPVLTGSSNNAHAVAVKSLEKFKWLSSCDIEIYVRKGVPVSVGLGSSGATAAGAAFALSLIAGSVDEETVLSLAGEGERFVSGVAHYDNVAASLLGGVVIVDTKYKKAYKIEIPKEIHVGVVIPETGARTEKKTYVARSILPGKIDLETHVQQSSSLAKLVYGLIKGDLRLVGRAISEDEICEPSRSKLIPLYREMKDIALREGAYGFNIAGAGPSVFYIHDDLDEITRIGGVILDFLKSKGVKASLLASRFSNQGVEVVSGG
ncbi:homoserine kinase [Thermogladius calderae 1633]|uniref:Homoserine kinase n=1 Tax=Thermogladius calderae (strain DSM 22663 / VKM B-2946 / 1633) TaxID=1184251 RepID=I3TEL9_THEC1|nr:homoserine kinase [Thermogladius calderae]AFK51207.1 homoserine kinase [Thermogladius calderae 1633]